MIKKILLVIFFILMFVQTAISKEIFKITSVNFDAANSLIFLSSPDNTSEEIMKHVKLIKLQNPKRVYFDIDSAILTSGTQNWFLNSGGVRQIRISQFSSNPAKIRVVLYLDNNFDQSKIEYLKVNNNIALKFSGGIIQPSYFQNTYRDEKTFDSDVYTNLLISNEDIEKINSAPTPANNDLVLNQVQQSFASTKTTTSATQNQSDLIKKEFKLKSKYYLNSVMPKKDGFLLSGFGSASIEKPIYLVDPARVAFDIANVYVNPAIRNKDYKLGTDLLKINQIEANKARITITSPDLGKYFPVYSADAQSVLFIKSEGLDLIDLFTRTNDALSYDVSREPSGGDDFVIAFNSPVVHSVKRENSKLVLNLYNTLRFNENSFKNAVKGTNFENMVIDLLPKVGLRVVLPLDKNVTVRTYLGADGKTVKIVLKGLPPKTPVESAGKSTVTNIILPKCKGKRTVVLDAGHGGSDYGAIRSGINEKDINLDVIKRVQAILASKGVSVALTRDTDIFVPLPDRTAFCANTSPDIFVSVHVNSSVKEGISGIETHYYHSESLELANTVHASLTNAIKAKDRGLFKSKFYVINHTNVPAILVEIGFISNPQERSELVSESRKQQTAKAISEGILKYLNGKN